jgi:hypothetical protein
MDLLSNLVTSTAPANGGGGGGNGGDVLGATPGGSFDFGFADTDVSQAYSSVSDNSSNSD